MDVLRRTTDFPFRRLPEVANIRVMTNWQPIGSAPKDGREITLRRTAGWRTTYEGFAIWRAATAENAEGWIDPVSGNPCQNRRTGRPQDADIPKISFQHYRKVSNIEQRFRNLKAHADSITAPPLAAIGDRESVALPPNAEEHRALIQTILDRY
jgi:hypothetical protein